MQIKCGLKQASTADRIKKQDQHNLPSWEFKPRHPGLSLGIEAISCREKNYVQCLGPLKGTYHLWIPRLEFFHFWHSERTILFKHKNISKLKKFKFKSEI